MYRPNRIGPWPCADIEVPPWVPSTTLKAAIDNVTAPLIGGGVRSVTVPTIHNMESIYLAGTMTSVAADTMFALGCLISGVNPEPDNNIVYTVSGEMLAATTTADATRHIFPVISKLDATPSDPDAVITLTDYSILPTIHNTHNTTVNNNAAVNCQLVVGDIRGSTPAQSNLPIFVGWAMFTTAAAAVATYMIGSISVHKYLEDVRTQDPWR